MTDILTLGNLLRLARDTVSNPREGANTVLSFAPERQALWLMFVLVIVLSLLLREFVAVFAGFPMDGPITGPMQGSTLALGLVMAGFLYLTMHAVHRIGQFFGGTGSFEETALLVIWLQFILICLQVIQIATLFILPPVAGLITIVAIALYVWLLVNFIAVLHGFTSLGMVFVATLLSGFALLFAFSLVLTLLGPRGSHPLPDRLMPVSAAPPLGATRAKGTPMYDIDKIRSDFPILSREVNGKPLVYLDNGASAQKPQGGHRRHCAGLFDGIRQRASGPALPVEPRDREIRSRARHHRALSGRGG